MGAPKIDKKFIPKHIALVMDGNGRWAQQRGLKRTEGHKVGEEKLMDAVDACIELGGVEWLSAYAFSTENWKRSPSEVHFLMNSPAMCCAVSATSCMRRTCAWCGAGVARNCGAA